MPELFLRCAGRAPSGAAGWIWQTSAAPWGTFDCSNKVVGTGMSHARRTAGMGAAGCCSGIRMQRIVATYMQQHVAAAALRPKGQPVECKGYFCIYFWMLRHSVVRSMLRLRAARVRFPPHARRASNSLSFSPSGMVPYAASGGKGLLLPRAPEGTRLDVQATSRYISGACATVWCGLCRAFGPLGFCFCRMRAGPRTACPFRRPA